MIAQIFKQYRGKIVFASMLSVMSALAGIGIMSLIVEEVSSLEEKGGEILYSFRLFLIAISALLVFGFSSGYMLRRLSASLAFELRSSMVKRFLVTSFEQIEKIGGHRVFATLTGDVNNITQGLMLLPNFVYSSVTVLACLGYMFYSSWKLSLVVLVFLIFVLLVAVILMRLGVGYQQAVRTKFDVMFKGIKALVDGRKELSSSRQRKLFFFNQAISPTFESIRKQSNKTALVYVFLNNWTTSQIFCVIAVVVYGSQYIIGDVSLAVVVGFVLVILYMVEPLINVVDMLEEMGSYQVAYRRINSLELGEDSLFNALSEPVESLSWQSISTHDLVYKYQNDDDEYEFTVGPVNETFTRGDIVFLTGGNGSGKTTFAKVLVGLYSPSAGNIAIDENMVGQQVNKTAYLNLFSTIFSDFFLFDQVLNKQGELAQDDMILQHLKALSLDTIVGSQNGLLSSTNLSHGQRKRLALLIALMEDADVFVFDEWAADQDPHFRHYFYTEILPRLKCAGKTVLVISHDEKYFDAADHLVKFESGKIISSTRKASDEQLFVAPSKSKPALAV